MPALDKRPRRAILHTMTNITPRIDAALTSALNEKRIVGAVIAVMQDGELVHFKPYGLANRELSGIETLFLLADPSMIFVSSSLVREIAQHGGDTSQFVPAAVSEAASSSAYCAVTCLLATMLTSEDGIPAFSMAVTAARAWA